MPTTDPYTLCEEALASYLYANLTTLNYVTNQRQVTRGSDENLSFGADYHVVIKELPSEEEKLSSIDYRIVQRMAVDLYCRWIGEEKTSARMTAFKGDVVKLVNVKPAPLTSGAYAVPGVTDMQGAVSQEREFNFVKDTPTPAFISLRVVVEVEQYVERK